MITLGNHTFDKHQIRPMLEENRYLLRPANYTARAPGRGTGYYDMGRCSVRVISLQGRVNLNYNCDNPFTAADRILKEAERATFTLVDFHAEATSEKLAMGYYLDGRISALWGTHTHVQTADEQILPRGTGYLTDAGMTGPVHSVIGMPAEQSIEGFLGGLRGRHTGPAGVCAARCAVHTRERYGAVHGGGADPCGRRRIKGRISGSVRSGVETAEWSLARVFCAQKNGRCSMVKIFTCGGFSSGQPFAGLTSEQARARRREGRENIARLANYANAGHVDLVLLAGDLFDSGEIYRQTAETLAKALGTVEGRVFIAPGNHDYWDEKRALRAGELAGERPYFLKATPWRRWSCRS